jgi:3-isopropylmalate/(R)-2-methylmalate dehydratase large subunit
MGRSLFEKVWDQHVVKDLGDGWVLMHIDRHLLHDLSGAPGLNDLVGRKLTPRNPELAFATADHLVASMPGRTGKSYPVGAALWTMLKQYTSNFGIRYFELGQRGQGIVHVMGPELGITMPGMTVVCGDSHTCTNGALGALAFGIGSSEIVHVLATQTLRQQKPKTMRIRYEGQMPAGVTPKDLILHVIGRFGAAAGTGYAVEFAGNAIRDLDVEGRFTICNLSVEMGAKYGMIAPDQRTFDYLKGRPFAPSGSDLDRAIEYWTALQGDDDADFDREEVVDVTAIVPTVTWGTSPEHTLPIDGVVPDPAKADPALRKDWEAALEYMGLVAGAPISGTKVDWVFIGSCANSRLSDLRDAARVVSGRKVAEGVNAWVVPGSEQVKRDAEAEGLDRIFKEAGFQWREPGCSLCVAANGDKVPKGARAVSTSNRNFVGRQGPGARTHLASPAMAAAAAIAGALIDVRELAS